jgi:predicted NUDIX family phosphoesterase
MENNFNTGDRAINVYGQEVEVSEIDDDSVVFIDVINDSVDVLRVEEFGKCFRKVLKNDDDIKEPSRKEFKRMVG